MKKVLVLLVVMVSLAVKVSANEPGVYTLFSRMNNVVTVKGLAQYLDADSDQKEQLARIVRMTDEKMKFALKEGSVVMADKALTFNLGNMKILLSEEQYKKYLTILNVSLHTDGEILMAGR